MNELRRINKIDKSGLSNKDYFSSLLLIAAEQNIINQNDFARIQTEIYGLLKQKTESYSSGKSSSARNELAAAFIRSVFYSAGIYLKQLDSPEEALVQIKTASLAELEHKGFEIIGKKLERAKLIHTKLVRNLFKTQNVFYRSTLVDGINGFFKLYRPEFSADEIHITADYPLYIRINDLAGIEFIEKYLLYASFENKFCKYFDPVRVHTLLLNLNENYAKLIMNIYEPVLTASLCAVLTKQDPYELSPNSTELRIILKEKTESEISQMLSICSSKLNEQLRVPTQLGAYIKMSVPQLAFSLRRASEQNCLERIVPLSAPKIENYDIVISGNERMKDIDYTKLLNKLMQSTGPEEKTSLILKNTANFEDLLEILKDSYPTKDELYHTLSALPAEAICAVAERYPNNDFLSDDRDELIYDTLNEFLSSLSPEQAHIIREAASRIKFN